MNSDLQKQEKDLTLEKGHRHRGSRENNDPRELKSTARPSSKRSPYSSLANQRRYDQSDEVSQFQIPEGGARESQRDLASI